MTDLALPAASPVTPAHSVLRRFLSLALIHGVLIAGAIFMLAPFIWMLVTSIKPPAEIFSAEISLWPKQFYGVENFSFAMEKAPLLRFALNGVILCGGILIVQLLVAIPCAYAIAKLKFRAARLMMVLVMLGLLVPIHATALPLYVAFDRLAVLNSYTALVAPFSISVFAIFLFLQFFRAIPDDLIHAARLDGMSEIGIVARVVVPNAWPAITAFAIFSVVAHWNDLFWPLVVVTNQNYATPPLGLLYFRAAEAGDDYGALMAATLIITLPLVAAFLVAQKRFVEGITMTGLKG